MADRKIIRNLAQFLGMAEDQLARAMGGARDWPALLHGWIFGNGREPRPREIPASIWNRIQEMRRRTGMEPPDAAQRTSPRIRTRVQRVPQRQGEENELGEFIRTPNSTNVYGFQYYRRPGEKLGMLYVTFIATEISNVTTKVKSHNGRPTRPQLTRVHERQGVVGAKTGGRGATYFYSNVPPSVYRQLLTVKDKGDQHGPGVKSPGTGVWQLLRVRGTIFGHKFNYGLFQGQLNPDGTVYIPRKATANGFRTRSLRDAGIGRGGFRTSTLPAN